MKKKIFFLAPLFAPSELTGGIRSTKFAKYLDRFGFDVTVLTFEHQTKINVSLLDGLQNVKIELCGKPKKIIFNDLGLAFTIQGFFKALKIAKKFKPNYVFVSMPTFLNSILALIIKKLYKIEYILDYRDLWVGDPYPSKGLKSRLFKKISTLIEPIILKSCYFSSYVSKEMLGDQLRLYPWLKKDKTHIISTGYDHEDIEKIILTNNKNRFLAHVGNADIDMNLSDLIEIVKLTKIQKILIKKKLKFLFVGSKNNILQELLDGNIKKFFIFKNYLPHSKALQLMADSKGLIILGSNVKQRLNRKVFEYTSLNSNIFYLGNEQSATAQIIKNSSGIVSSPKNKVKKFTYFLQNLRTSRPHLMREYQKEYLVKKFCKLL